MTSFDRLHPSLQHHIVNSLGWRALRPLQEATIDPVLEGEHALLLAPTAGGKTEAAIFPVLSRVASERWVPLSVLYLAPLRALLNNLLPRIERYAAYTGNRVGLWHGDIGPSQRTQILSDPPDILLTTPESLEAMLISTRVDPSRFFRALRTVVVDEVHAFASDDRGWHMLAVLERLTCLAGRQIQRIGLSATVGNPGELLDWLSGSSQLPSRVIAPTSGGVTDQTDVELDWVGSLANAARVLSQIHLGEKRLVFVDSRARAEELTSILRDLDVKTFLSHGSLGREERLRTESAFSESQNCVIVATSTLELGIDIGDLDRVVQIDAPSSVASFLQRLGRTGRRPGSTRNALFLGTRSDGFLQAAGLARLWADGYVEPVVPPAFPVHILAQQIMALGLQEHGIGKSAWPSWLGDPNVLGADVEDAGPHIVAYMLSSGILHSDQGILSFGVEGEATFGQRNFLELMSAFTSEPVFTVRAGRQDVGIVPNAALLVADANEGRMLLAGRHWFVDHVDYQRRVITVLPASGGGKVRFWGEARPLSYQHCQSIRSVLAGRDVGARLSIRAQDKIGELRREAPWLDANSAGTALVQDDQGRKTWWTFAGSKANLEMAARLTALRQAGGAVDNLSIAVDASATLDRVIDTCRAFPEDEQIFTPPQRMIDGLKFSEALPPELAARVAQLRFADFPAVSAVLEGQA